MSEFGITDFGAYFPRLRLDRAAIAGAHQWMAPSLKGLAKGERAFCNWDEDAITLAVEAGRDCLGAGPRGGVTSVTLASTTAPYADLQNAAIVSGALALGRETETIDLGGSQRAGLSGLARALRVGGAESLFIASDRPKAKPASTQEMTYGAGAAAFRLGASNVIARPVGWGAVSALFVDHFRAAGADHDYYWEERWIRDEGYAKLIPQAVTLALVQAGCGMDDIAVMVMASPMRGAGATTAKLLGFKGALADTLDSGCGYAGTAHPLLMLAGALEQASPGQKIIVIAFGQGAEALILETTDALGARKDRKGVAGCLADSVSTSDYLRMASFYGEIDLEWGMRGEKTGKAALTTQYREAAQLESFQAGKCRACGTVQFPQLAYCVNPACAKPAAQFTPLALTEEPARVLTYTSDWLSYHPAPPLYVGFVQFDVGARLLMEMVDVGPTGLDVGTPLRMVFRIKEPDKVRGYNRYFWKATPVAA